MYVAFFMQPLERQRENCFHAGFGVGRDGGIVQPEDLFGKAQANS